MSRFKARFDINGDIYHLKSYHIAHHFGVYVDGLTEGPNTDANYYEAFEWIKNKAYELQEHFETHMTMLDVRDHLVLIPREKYNVAEVTDEDVSRFRII